MTGTRDRQNLLDGPHDAATTTLTFTYEPDFGPGDILAIDLELMYVWTVPDGSNTATVLRGYRGSTVVTHANGALVTVSPVISDFAIFRALNAELASLSSSVNGLFAVDTVSVTWNSAVVGYDLTGVTDLIDVLAVYWDEVGPEKVWPEVHHWELRRNMDTGDFASGLQILIPEGQPGNDIRVVYKKPFTPLTSTSNDMQADVGLPATANDIPPLGVAYRLISSEEIQRNFSNSQGDTRRAAEVPAGAQLKSAQGMAALWKRRVDEEAARLSTAYPYKKRGLGY